METTAVARSMRGSVGMLAMDWLMDPSTLEKAAQRGMAEGLGAYATGRLGVLGGRVERRVLRLAQALSRRQPPR
ncbi:MAG: hypothetical protein F4Y76_12195 [Acidimicrobiales bacterium]|nr:hypothetical protein [Acidimicrobiales bacterium]MYJ47688.1 hypothetical protein [Acidimicrobiales bacterium]